MKLVKTKCIEVVDLETIVDSENNNIFFIETNERLSEFHARVLCAFESAAIHNPLKKVQGDRTEIDTNCELIVSPKWHCLNYLEFLSTQ